MSLGEKLAPAFGRGLIAALFLLAGLLKLQNWDGSLAMLEAHGVQFRPALLATALLVELLCGTAILIGFRTRMAALILFGYTLAVNYVLHDFWVFHGDPAMAVRYAAELQLFVKNMAIAGGLLLLVGHGAGDWSFDSWRGE